MHVLSGYSLFALLEIYDTMGEKESMTTASGRSNACAFKRCSLGRRTDYRPVFVAFEFLAAIHPS